MHRGALRHIHFKIEPESCNGCFQLVGNIRNKVRIFFRFVLRVVLLKKKSVLQIANSVLQRGKAVVICTEFRKFALFKIFFYILCKEFNTSFVPENQSNQNKNGNKESDA